MANKNDQKKPAPIRRPASKESGNAQPTSKLDAQTENTFEDIAHEGARADRAVAATILRGYYTRERHYFLMRIVYTLMAALAFETAIVCALAMRRPIENILVENQAGQLVQVTPLSEPVQAMSFIETWMTQAIVAANTYDFANYRYQLTQARPFFTKDGWDSWLKALQDSGNLEAVIQNKTIISAVPAGAPVETAQGVVSGIYTWKFQIPIILSYNKLGSTSTQKVYFLVTIVRVPVQDNPQALGIQSITFTDGTADQNSPTG